MSREPASRSRLLWKTCTEFTEIAAIHLWKSPGKPPNRLRDVKQIRSTGATPLPAGGFAWPEVAPHRAGAPPTRGPCYVVGEPMVLRGRGARGLPPAPPPPP